MSQHTPAVDFIAALDAPLDVVRRQLGKAAPTMAVLIFTGVLTQIPTQFVTRYMMADLQSGNLSAVFGWYSAILAASCVSIPLLLIGVAAEAVCIGALVSGRPVDLLSTLRGTFRLHYLLATVLSWMFGLFMAATCCLGSIILLPMGLLVPVSLEEGRGIDSIQRSMDLGMMRTGPAWYDRPGWKVLAVTVAYFVLAAAIGTVAQIPVFASMGWEVYDAVKSGDPQRIATLGSVNPWAATVGMLLGGAARLFTDTYYWAGVFLIFRDARERFAGEGLEAAIGDA